MGQDYWVSSSKTSSQQKTFYSDGRSRRNCIICLAALHSLSINPYKPYQKSNFSQHGYFRGR